MFCLPIIDLFMELFFAIFDVQCIFLWCFMAIHDMIIRDMVLSLCLDVNISKAVK